MLVDWDGSFDKETQEAGVENPALGLAGAELKSLSLGEASSTGTAELVVLGSASGVGWAEGDAILRVRGEPAATELLLKELRCTRFCNPEACPSLSSSDLQHTESAIFALDSSGQKLGGLMEGTEVRFNGGC